METIFKVGDKVFDIRFGWGEVKEIQEEGVHLVRVDFDNCSSNYTKDGKGYYTDLSSMLSFTEYDLVNGGFSQERQINYHDYVGKWGKFWNEGDKVVIDTLAEIDTEEYGRMVFGPYITNMYYDNFEPLTEEQIKVLAL